MLPSVVQYSWPRTKQDSIRIMEDEEIVRRRNNEPIDLGAEFHVYLDNLSINIERFTIEQFIASLEATTTLMHLTICFCNYKPTPDNNRRVIEPLCRCIANLRRHNPNHPLRTLRILYANQVNDVDQLLVAAKRFGIHHLVLHESHIQIQSLEEFCRDNSNLKVLKVQNTHLLERDSTISVSPQNGPHDSFAILALDELTMRSVTFENSTVATKSVNFFADVTYPALSLGGMIMRGDDDDDEVKEFLSGIIKPTVKELTLESSWPIEVMDAIEACPSVTQIQHDHQFRQSGLRRSAVQRKLQAIAARNRALARFVADPRAYAGDELLTLMRQFDNCPTGRYMLARCLPGIPSFFKIQNSTDSSTTGPKKRKRRH